MSTQKEGFYTKLGVILAVLGLILGYLYWRYPLQSWGIGAPQGDTAEPLHTSGATGTKAEPPEPEPTPSPPESTDRPPHTEEAASELPAEFTLSDGEQKVLLSGQASVGIQFNQIGEERFLTLRINSAEGSVNHAILGTSARFRFRQGGSDYYVSVLRLDYAARAAVLRVDPAITE